MHTTTIEHSEHAQGVDLKQTFVVHHNGDYSGDAWFAFQIDYEDFFGNKRVELNKHSWGADFYTVRIPFDVLIELVGNYYKSEAISSVESASGKEFLDQSVK